MNTDEMDALVSEAKASQRRVKATDKEKKFLDIILADPKKNAKRAAMIAFECKDEKSASALGSRLVKKFGIVRRTNIKEIPDASTDHGKAEALIRLFNEGKITGDFLFLKMAEIGIYDVDPKARVPALKVLMEWRQMMDARESAKQLPEADVTKLLVEALSKVSREKYIQILKEVRARRVALIKKRNEQIPVDEIIENTKQELLSGGQVHGVSDSTNEPGTVSSPW